METVTVRFPARRGKLAQEIPCGQECRTDTLLPGSGEQTQCVGYIQIDSEDIDGFPAEYAEILPCMCLYNRFQLLF